MHHTQSVFTQHHYLTDGGLETTLIFHQGIQLNHFAAFELLGNDEGRAALREYYMPYLALAEKRRLAFVLESPTWRASSDWGFKLGYTPDELFSLNMESIQFIREVAQPYNDALPQLIVSGNIGPRGDGYKADTKMTPDEAKAYHLDQVKAFSLADADVVTAVTITYSDEAIGIINAARLFNLPVVISFTVETDGTLPSGESLQAAIERTDTETDRYAEHYMINCAHPLHFMHTLHRAQDWQKRIRGIRANASTKSHAELNESDALDTGNTCLLSDGYRQLFHLLPDLRVIGGCCGTDHSHVEAICAALEQHWLPAMHAA